MFAKTIIDSDAFLDMPLSTQALYFHLSMRADDDGFINSPKKIQRTVGASDDDLKLLIAKNFIIPFESGVVVIKHWRIHNYIQKDRYTKTVYQEEMQALSIKENKAYTINPDTRCIQNGYSSDTQVSIGKVSIVKDNKEKGAPRFVPPSVEEVRAYCTERKNHVDPEAFVDYYERQGWVLSNGQKMKDWKSGVRTWEKRDAERARQQANEKPKGGFYQIMEHEHTDEKDKEEEMILLRKGREKWKNEQNNR